MKDDKKEIKNVYCPLPWIHANFTVDGMPRLCCNSLNSTTDKNLTINNINSYTEDFLKSENISTIRNKMINGIRPIECQKCYSIEDAGGRSNRQAYYDLYGFQNEIKIKYIQIALTNKCNLKCTMCWPGSSQRLMKEFDQYNFEYDKNRSINASMWDENKVLKFIDIHKNDLEVLSIHGGEPFINPIHKKILENLVKDKVSSKIKLVYNTNGTILPTWLSEIWKSFKDVKIQISIEGTDKLNEYIRYGTRWDTFVKNLNKFQKLQYERNYFIRFHIVMMASNIFEFPKTLKWITEETDFVSVPYINRLVSPSHLSCGIMPPELKNRFDDIINQILKIQFRDSKNDIIYSCIKHIISEINYHKKQPYDENLWNKFIDYHKKLESGRKNNLSDIIEYFKPYW
ncbi:MAG: twitch domain-containing radical SAM protein [Candidimonas sp.]